MDTGTRVEITVFDLALEKQKDGKCADWVLVENKDGGKRQVDLMCGYVPLVSLLFNFVKK